ncbi:hypothetical protein [Methyloglobulus sp.]|uniref:hypothetical protein n=1 Tax=Methyloglobulus sp. TaxID=2518622 RepID=UPI003989127B
MPDSDKQEMLLMAIEYLKIQYDSLQNPCIALYISRHCRLLSLLNIPNNKQESYAQHSKSWLTCHMANPRHSQEMQTQLSDFVQLSGFNSSALLSSNHGTKSG